MIRFYDTCSLLDELQHAFIPNEKFYISAITLQELENIKTSVLKDSSIKYKARRLIQLLAENEDKYNIVQYKEEDKILSQYGLPISNDSKIIYCAMDTFNGTNKLTFITKDLSCKLLAKQAFSILCQRNGIDKDLLQVNYLTDKDISEYTGFYIAEMENEDILADFYSNLSLAEYNPFNLLINQYLIIKLNGEIIDQYKMTENGLKKVNYCSFKDNFFGETKPKDIYQLIAMDTLKNNTISMIRGAAGTGKSYLALTCLFDKMAKHEIDRIVIFCNTIATADSAKLGYYPGSRDEKLLDSQIGNFLRSKIPEQTYVEKYLTEGKIVLLPMSDIRGYDTTGLRAGVYITEAQNLNIELMKLAIQRIGEDSICILDGDSDTQVDSPQYAGANNGMRRLSEVFRGDSCYGEVTLQNIHRSHIAALAQKM